MPKISAGLLVYRLRDGVIEVFLVHPGGPFWAKKDPGAWSIPKGLIDKDEESLAAAQREFKEETGLEISGHFAQLTPAKMKSGKVVRAWAVEGDCDPSAITSNTFSMEWPPNSGRQQEFPEIDRAAWFGIEEAKKKINQGQIDLLEELLQMLTKKNIPGN
jgi:predicted NUDIX family NTP pyrophosphohydrolase